MVFNRSVRLTLRGELSEIAREPEQRSLGVDPIMYRATKFAHK